MTADMFSLS